MVTYLDTNYNVQLKPDKAMNVDGKKRAQTKPPTSGQTNQLIGSRTTKGPALFERYWTAGVPVFYDFVAF